MLNRLITCILLLPVWLSSGWSSSSASDQAVVYAVLFYSPNCGHCHLVITEALPPLFEKYSEQLYIVGVDISQAGGQALFMAALDHFGLESGGVPFLVVGDTYLVGSRDIPEQFPGLIDQYLAQGGVDWPAIPGLAEALQAPQPTEASTTPTSPPEPTQTAPPPAIPDTPIPAIIASPPPTSPVLTPTAGLIITGESTSSPGTNFARDPGGNTISVIVLLAMLLTLGRAVVVFLRSTAANPIGSLDWLVPVLCVVGIGVAGYLAYVETAHVEAVCGPVGDCNTVQQSEYAQLFGILPIGTLGVVGYVLIILSWLAKRLANRRLAAYGAFAMFGMTTFGLLFSIYLTFLEPFVIGATCAWCLTSAVIMTALFWLSLLPGKAALSYILNGENYAYNRSSSQRAL
ncbi:MAG: hypothetical protein JW726_12030 [Anaerolineales bacterium]|nr:hypothetical protein [Anaerolineales bacterium]